MLSSVRSLMRQLDSASGYISLYGVRHMLKLTEHSLHKQACDVMLSSVRSLMRQLDSAFGYISLYGVRHMLKLTEHSLHKQACVRNALLRPFAHAAARFRLRLHLTVWRPPYVAKNKNPLI